MARFANAESFFPLADLKARLGIDGDGRDAEVADALQAALSSVVKMTWRRVIGETETQPRTIRLPCGMEPLEVPYSSGWTGVATLKGWATERYDAAPSVDIAVGFTYRAASGNLVVVPTVTWPSALGQVTLTADWDWTAAETSVLRTAVSLLVRADIVETMQRAKDYAYERASEMLDSLSVRTE